MVAIADKNNMIHVQQGEQHKDSIPCEQLQEGEVITQIGEYHKGLLISGDKGSLLFYYPTSHG